MIIVSGSGDSSEIEDDVPTEQEPPEVPSYTTQAVNSETQTPNNIDIPEINIDARNIDQAKPKQLPDDFSGGVVVGEPGDGDATGQAGEADGPPAAPVEPRPVGGSASRPDLHSALFTYALPVVCAWFGSIVTDLF